MESNVKKTALILEGGGMRGAFTAGILNNLLQQGIYFDYVTGISAGSSGTVNYLTRDQERIRKSFIDVVEDSNFGGWKSFFKGEGFFASEYIYEKACLPDGKLPFNFDAFFQNPAQIKIGAFEGESGKMVYWGKDDIKESIDVMKMVRASSSMPVFMPPTKFRGKIYLDGGIGGGISLDQAIRDGYENYFIVRTRRKEYRKKPMNRGMIEFVRKYYRDMPQVAENLFVRHEKYNEIIAEMETLEKNGQALVVYPEIMDISNREIKRKPLEQTYRQGLQQGRKEMKQWKQWLQERE